MRASSVLGMTAFVGIEDQLDRRVDGVVRIRDLGADLVLHALVALDEVGMELVEHFALLVLHAEEHAAQLQLEAVDLGAQEERVRRIDAVDVGVDRAFS